MGLFQRLFGTWSSLMAFNRLPPADRQLVFYAESRADWPHLGPILEELTRAGRTICYVTSEQSDPILTRGDARIRAFHIGSGTARTTFFKTVRANVVVMTLPDLETFYLKRSVHPDVRYVYVFHSMASTHMSYRKGAFDAFDTVLCVGPHHAAEIRKTEEIYGLRRKDLQEHGYARLDAILHAARSRPAFVPTPGPSKRIVLAPSWGACSSLEGAHGDALVKAVLDARHRLVVRLHPMTVRRLPGMPAALSRAHGADPDRFQVVTDMNEQESLLSSDLMISDWSGAALDYAFGLERPVLFVDMPKKVNNPEFEKLGLPPLEVSVREEIGTILPLEDIASAPSRIAALTADPAGFRDRIRRARERWIYHVGRSAEVAAAHIARLLDAPVEAPHEEVAS